MEDRQSEPRFLSTQTVLEIHAAQIAEHGGDPGLRDAGLLDSAMAQPVVSIGGQYLHEDLFAMAAAYLFHLTNNHAFVDGNKWTGLAAALVFLDANGFEVDDSGTEMADVVLEMVEEKRDMAWLAAELRRRASDVAYVVAAIPSPIFDVGTHEADHEFPDLHGVVNFLHGEPPGERSHVD